MESAIGLVVVAGWGCFVLWSIGRIVLSVRRGGEWKRDHAIGLIASAALASGVVLFIKNGLPFDTVGVGFVLAAGGSFVLWVLGNAADSRGD